MRFLGARVVLTPAAGRALGRVRKATELAEAHAWFMTRQFENPANADIHSRATAREIVVDFAGRRLEFVFFRLRTDDEPMGYSGLSAD